MKLDPVKPASVSRAAAPKAKPPELVPVAKLTSADADELGRWLEIEARRVGQPDSDPGATLVRLRDRAGKLSQSGIQSLKRTALNVRHPIDERFLAIYLLGLTNKDIAVGALKDITQSPLPSTSTDRRHSDEIICRTQALEALVKKMSPKESKLYLQRLIAQLSDPILVRHVQFLLDKLS